MKEAKDWVEAISTAVEQDIYSGALTRAAIEQVQVDARAELEQEVRDYKEVLEDKRRLVRELDVVLNGEAGAAKQASLCDLVAQVKKVKKNLDHWEL